MVIMYFPMPKNFRKHGLSPSSIFLIYFEKLWERVGGIFDHNKTTLKKYKKNQIWNFQIP